MPKVLAGGYSLPEFADEHANIDLFLGLLVHFLKVIILLLVLLSIITCENPGFAFLFASPFKRVDFRNSLLLKEPRISVGTHLLVNGNIDFDHILYYFYILSIDKPKY